MRRASRFVIGSNWRSMLSDMQIDLVRVLAYAGLPADLFQRGDVALSPSEYFRLWRGMELAAGDREIALLLVDHFRPEAFDAPIFASLSSPDFNVAVNRLSRYKPLIGPMLLDVQQDHTSTRLTLGLYGSDEVFPRTINLTELVFFCQLIRVGTRERIVPQAVFLPELPDNVAPYEAYFGCPLKKADRTEIRFSASDAAKPFLTSSDAMWAFFESRLNQKLADMGASASTTERVRAVLMEALPGGEVDMETVARRLAMSKRTLQRKLTAEDESFQGILAAIRVELADQYLKKSTLSLAEISFLLGFQEPNSFIRAYQAWKGVSPGAFRTQLH